MTILSDIKQHKSALHLCECAFVLCVVVILRRKPK